MKLIVSAIALGVATLALGQSTTDHPNLKSNNGRTGVNGDVINSDPGRLTTANGLTASSLRWYLPFVSNTPVESLRLNEINPMKTIIDNTDAGATINLDEFGNDVGPYDPLPNGAVASTGTWFAPTTDEAAQATYVPVIRRNANAANAAPFQGRNPNLRWPAHLWAATTSSLGGVGGDPRQAIVPANLSTFSWVFSPRISTLVAGNYVVTNDATPKGYALYVWIPAGLVSPGGVSRPRPRYMSYEVTYGIGQKYVDVVDTEASGFGWVRLGNGGHPTNQLFQYAGLDGLGNPYPITIKLYNTIVRNSLDQLTETVDATHPDNRFSVLADAALFSAETDSYVATPTSAGFGTTDIRVIGARNEVQIDPNSIPSVTSTDWTAKPLSIGNGVVRSYDYNTGTERWRYSPLEEGTNTTSFEDTNVRFIASPGFTSAADNANARGGEYLKGTVDTVAVSQNVTVDPQTDLAEGSYDVYMYVGGDVAGVNYAQSAQYEIFEGGVSAGQFTLDMSKGGWVRLGNRRYVHSVANPLTVMMTNHSANATDAGKSIYVDQFRFVGAVGTQITSTPVEAEAYVRQTPGVDPVLTKVVIVADERGYLHCLDATGNADGTTTCYWTYPSSTDAANDPNLQPGQDPTDPNAGGVYQKFDGESDTLEATMPTDFDLSTAVVQRLTVTTPGGPIDRDFLIIGSKNGRIYSIAMEGRGDFSATNHTPGTTFRSWTYPETFPAASPQPTLLGSIASVVSGTTTGGQNVIYVATEQGRIYCLDATGDFNYSNGKELKTSVVWQYPPQTSDTLPAISGAPVLDQVNHRLFFGTHYVDGNPSRFMALNADTGATLWATTNNSINDAIGTPPTQLDWFSGACYVSAAELNTNPTAAAQVMPDTVFAMNENGNVYAINAGTGDVLWRTNELQSGGLGSIVYTRIITYDTTGAPAEFPVIMVPTDSGRFAALFARLGEETRFGNRLAWGYEMDASIQATMTVSNKWLFGATTNGYLLAWSDLANAGSTLTGPGPGNETAADNDPAYDEYRNCEVAFLSRAGFVALRQNLSGAITGTEPYANVIDTALPYTKPYGRLKAPYKSTHGAAFEWGETIYLIAYNFPYKTQDTSGNDVAPPVVEATVTTEGRASRPIAAEARLFSDKTSADSDGGYAIFQIPLTAGGGTAQTPGPGSIRVQLRTSAVNNNNTQQSITLNPALTNLDYQVANPIGISVENTFTTSGTSTEQLGYTNDPTREDALANGSPNLTVTGVGLVNGLLFGKSVGTTAHGSAKKTNVYVFDRSLVTLLRGEGRGIDLVKVDRKDLRWQGGTASIYKPFALVPGLGALLGNFEDLPVNFPNNSLDYPDIAREDVQVRKEPNGNVENPVFNPVSLKGPLTASGIGFVDESNASTRVIVPTTFEFEVDVPKYQPANAGNISIPNQNGTFWQAGYAGRFTVYVDSDQSGSFGGSSREAYRTFNLGAAVSPDEKITIGTPNVDLGSLSAGAGYDTRLTYSPTFPYRTLSPTTFFSPYQAEYSNMFKPFSAYNDGNVNLWNVRLAKGTYDVTGGLYWPWEVKSGGNNDDIWLDSAADVQSNIDGRFSPVLGGGVNTIFAAKPRVGDSSGKQIFVNPSSRINSNLPGSGFPLVPNNANSPTIVSVTPPLGTPIGKYSQLMRLVEDTQGTGPAIGANDESLSLGYTASGTVVPYESFSDPTFILSFTVKETQMTGGTSDYTDAIVDNGNAVDAAHTSQWADMQPSGLRLTSGSLMVAFASNRPSFYPAAGNTTPNSRNTHIFVGLVAGGQLGANDSRGQDSQIRDLNKFVPDDPANRRWMQALAMLPTVADTTIFGNTLTSGVASQTNIGGTLTSDVSYGNPVFSTNGDKDLAGLSQARTYVVYTGKAKRQTDSGVVDDSRIIVTRINTSGPPGQTYVLDADPFSLKGRPTMVQNGNNVTIFYPAFSNGVWSIYATSFNESTGFTVPQMLQFGTGFETVSSPSVVLRNAVLNGTATTEYDLTFTGRLRNSNVDEVFMARLDPNLNYRTFGTTATNGALVETGVYDARYGAYRVRGAAWSGDFDITVNGSSIITSTPVEDRQTGIQAATTIFGGRVVVDPMLGTVKLTGATLPKSAQLQVTYTPTFLRLSDTSVAGYNSTSALFDRRLESSNTAASYAFWKTPSGNDEPATSANTFADRLVVSAVRSATSAAASAQVSRPAMSTLRLGIRVGRSILVNADGSLAESVTVTGNTGSYQIDPAAGRIYFTRYDEDKVLRIQLGGGGSAAAVDISRPVTFIGESAENFITMDAPLNESNLFLFLDPVGTTTNRRGMIWMLWSSTRNGAPSIFMQTMARKIVPVLPPN